MTARGVVRHRRYTATMMSSVRRYRERCSATAAMMTSTAAVGGGAAIAHRDTETRQQKDSIAIDDGGDADDDGGKRRRRVTIRLHHRGAVGAKRTGGGRSFVQISPRLRLVIALSAIFVMATTPMAVAFVVDTLDREVRSPSLVRVLATGAVLIYTLLSPVLLVRHMTGLKHSLVKLLQPLKC